LAGSPFEIKREVMSNWDHGKISWEILPNYTKKETGCQANWNLFVITSRFSLMDS
jgi:hypothetical protein